MIFALKSTISLKKLKILRPKNTEIFMNLCKKFCGYPPRPFVKEVFWFKHALPALAKLYPEISKISPVCFYASSNYINSFMGRDMVAI